MTPSVAIHNSVFHLYLVIVAAVLVVAGAVLLIVSAALHKDVSRIWPTYRSWLVMVPLIALTILLGRIAVIIGCALLSLAGLREFAKATALDRFTSSAAAVLVVAVAAASWLRRLDLFMLAPLVAVVLMALIPILRDRTQGQLRSLGVAIVGFLLIGWMFAHLGYLANLPNPYGYLLYILFAAEISDVAAFTFGRTLGRHKLRPNISPGKTWEGAIGAFAVSMALPWLLRFSFPQLDPWELILSGLIVGVGGQAGDLTMSLIKRDAGVKDLGTAIPGHGGVLDRIDSLIFTAPLFFHMIHWSQKL